jgi:uncharacterized membrane protein YqiK
VISTVVVVVAIVIVVVGTVVVVIADSNGIIIVNNSDQCFGICNGRFGFEVFLLMMEVLKRYDEQIEKYR